MASLQYNIYYIKGKPTGLFYKGDTSEFKKVRVAGRGNMYVAHLSEYNITLYHDMSNITLAINNNNGDTTRYTSNERRINKTYTGVSIISL